MITYVIAGTGVTYPVGKLYYKKLLRLLDAELICLPGLGLRYSIEESGTEILEILQYRGHDQDGSVALVGHSQGGLVALEAQQQGYHTIDRVATIAAPLAGSEWASGLVPLKPVRDMVPNSDRLALIRNEDWDRTQNIHIHMQNDALCLPVSGGVTVTGGHIWSCLSNEVLDHVWNWSLQ